MNIFDSILEIHQTNIKTPNLPLIQPRDKPEPKSKIEPLIMRIMLIF